jgi:hypothetical protein
MEVTGGGSTAGDALLLEADLDRVEKVARSTRPTLDTILV